MTTFTRARRQDFLDEILHTEFFFSALCCYGKCPVGKLASTYAIIDDSSSACCSHQCLFVKILGTDRANLEQRKLVPIVVYIQLFIFIFFSLFALTVSTGNECANS
jgi:hypothetical protein